MIPLFETLNNSNNLAHVTDAIVSIPDLTPAHAGPVEYSAKKLESSFNEYENVMRNFLSPDIINDFKNSNIRTAAAGLANSLSDLLNGIKFFHDENFRNLNQALVRFQRLNIILFKNKIIFF